MRRQMELSTRSTQHGSLFRATAFPCLLALLLLIFVSPRAKADVGVVLNESLDESVDRISGTGHSAVYFSRICPESSVKLRLCGPGEHGSVMSNYINIGEDHAYEWNVVPLNIYLYGVEDVADRPIFGSYKIKHALEQRYRDKYLSVFCTTAACVNSSKSEWREMVAATMIRSVYIFTIETTEEQDRRLIAEFNDAPNDNHFNGVTRNCADFTRRVINAYFPNATHPDYLNDFGMTSPKAISRTFTHYAVRHPELNLRVFHFAQMPGTIKRSREVRAGTEQLVRSKKFLVPMAIFADYSVPVVAGSYLLTGRFNPEHEFERRAAIEENSSSDNSGAASTPNGRTSIVGTPQEWKDYHKAFEAQIVADIHEDIINNRKDLSRLFKQIDQAGTPSIDDHGLLWMEISANGQTTKVGLSASNVLDRDSDVQLAHELLLTRVDHVLKSPKHSRETMTEFVDDWAALQLASERHALIVAGNASTQKSTPPTPQTTVGAGSADGAND